MTRETLLLVPGLGGDARMWAPQISALRACADIQVTQEHLRHETIAGVAAAILAAAPQRFALAGTSWGGYVALEVVRQAAERVTRLALLNTSARADTPEQQAARAALVALAREQGLAAAVRARLPLTLHPARMSDAALVRLLLDTTRDAGIEAYARQMRGAAARADSRALLPKIRCPVLVLGGRQDALLPPALSEEMAAAIPGARLVLLDDCGHCGNLEQPDAVNTAMAAWLDASPSWSSAILRGA